MDSTGHEGGYAFNEDQRGGHSSPPAKKTLASQVSDLACRCIELEGIAGEMLATIQLNVERGYLVATNDEGKLDLEKLIASWKRQLARVDESYPKS